MSRVNHFSGAASSRLAEVCWSRWGGGALPGRTHVFLIYPYSSITLISAQCVVDDFGSLVEVPR